MDTNIIIKSIDYFKKNTKNIYNILYHLSSQKNSIFAKFIACLLRINYIIFSKNTPAFIKLTIIQVLNLHIICSFNQKTNYFNSENYNEFNYYYFDNLFYKAEFIDRFVTAYNTIFMFVFMIMFLFFCFYIIKGALYCSLNKYFSKSYTEPNVGIFFILPFIIIVLSFFDYFISNAYFKMILVMTYTVFFLILFSKMIEISNLYKKEFDKSIIRTVKETIGCKLIFCVPDCFFANYYIFSLNLNIRSWRYIPIILFINNKGVYRNNIYFSIDSINALNNNFNKKMVQYTKQEFEMLKIFNF